MSAVAAGPSAARPGERAGALTGALTGAVVGATGWLSLGVLAVVDPVRLTRVGALPPWSWLAALVLAGAAGGALTFARLRLAPFLLLILPWLPWLPVPVPAAFLLWDGPVEAVVWLAVVAGAVWPRRGASQATVTPTVRTRPATAPWIAVALSAGLAAASWVAVRPRVPAGDEPHYLVITQSLLRDGDLRIENNHRNEDYLAYYDAALKPDFMRRGTDRQIYSIHAPGVSAIMLPAFAVFGYAGAVATVILVVALGLGAVWRVAWQLTGSTAAAWAGWASVTCSAPMALHAFTIYPDPVGAALALAGVAALVRLETGGASYTAAAWLATGGALAVLPWLHTRFALVAGALGLVLAVRLVSRRATADLRRFLALPVVSAAAWFGYFYLIYGTPNPAAPYGARPEGGWSFIPSGVTGLLVDQQFGLVTTAPVLAAALAGLVTLARRRPRLTAELLAVCLPYLVATASYPMWWAGYSAPARFLVVLVPLLALPLAQLWQDAGVVGRRVIGGLVALSGLLTAATIAIDRGAFVYNGRDGHALLLDWLNRSVDLTLALPSVHRDGVSGALTDTVIWIAAAAGVSAGAVLVGRRWPRLAATAGVLAVPALVMLAATVMWAGHARGGITPSTSQMSWLERWFPDQAPLTFQFTPTRRLTLDDAPRRLNIATSQRGHRAAGDEPLLRIPELPAGDYDLFAEAPAALTGTLTVRLGRQDVPMEQWQLDGHPPGFTGLVLTLPVDAHSITVSGDGGARQSVRRLTLRPRQLAPRHDPRWSLRAARYGAVVVHGLDDNAYLEPGALWVRGEHTASFVVRPDGEGAVLRLKAGPVANVVTLAAGAWRRAVPLAPDAAMDVTLPPEALAPATLTVHSASGFRPSAHGGGGDVRWLGVYVTWP